MPIDNRMPSEGEWIEQLWEEYYHPEEAEQRYQEQLEEFQAQNK